MRVRSLLIVVAVVAASLAAGSPPAGAADPVVPVAIAASAQTCALLSDKTVKCWGYNFNGQVGDDTQANRLTPVLVPGITDATALAVGGNHTCVIVTAGAMKCWGYNQFGQLGDNSGTQRLSPVSVQGITGATAIAAGFNHTCAVVGGGVKCWGNNGQGQLGDGTGTSGASSLVPVNVSGLSGVTALAISGDHGCAIIAAGAVRCWGFNPSGEVGDGTSGNIRNAPVTVTGLTGATDLGLGKGHSCAILTGGTAKCWGDNTSGQIGDGTQDQRTTPTTVSGLTGATDIAGGEEVTGPNHTCAVVGGGVVRCWGTNDQFELGDGTTTMRLTPNTVPGITGATMVRAGLNDSCALLTGGVVKCWGFNGAGRLGDGTSTNRSTATSVTGFGPTTAPGVPAVGAVKPGNARASVSWTAPGNDGGSPITGYVVTPFIGAVEQPSTTFASAATTQVVTGLVNGTTYAFKVAAVNAIGTGPRSNLSAGVTPIAYHPFASWSAFVARQFLDLTGVAPSAASSSSWASQLGNGSKTKGDLILALRRGTDNLAHIDPVARLYRAFLGRAPDAGGLKFWVNRHRFGGWSLTRMADSFASSNEFKTKYGTLTNRQFVTRIYTDVLGRTADSSGVNYWTGKLDSGSRTRGGVMIGFSESNEYKRKQAENTDVAVAHVFLLNRTATTAETNDWVTRQKAGTSVAVLATELLDSSKYATHVTG
jgi:alpha-tubulin suppressor-like RCC1 family protein